MLSLSTTHSYTDGSSTVTGVGLIKGLKCWVSCGLQIGLCQSLLSAAEGILVKGDSEVVLNTHSHTIR